MMKVGIATKIGRLLAAAGLLTAFSTGVQAQSLPVTFHDKGFAYNQQWSDLGTVTASWTITSETATSITVQGDIKYNGQEWPFSGTATQMANQPTPTFMDSTMGGPDQLMWAVSPNGHHLWASNSHVSFTLGDPAVTYGTEKALLEKDVAKAGLMQTPSNSSSTTSSANNPSGGPAPVGGGGCTPSSINSYVDGQGWSDCGETAAPALYAQIVGNPAIPQGQSALFNYRVWWANSYATNSNSGWAITQVTMAASTGQNEVYETQLYPYSQGSSGSWSVSASYDGFGVSYTFGTSSTSATGYATNWSVDESGSWSPVSQEYVSDSTGNGLDSRIAIYTNSDQPTGWYTGTATANLQYWFPFASYWVGATPFDWYYEVVS